MSNVKRYNRLARLSGKLSRFGKLYEPDSPYQRAITIKEIEARGKREANDNRFS